MGRCHDFGVQVGRDCEQPMQAGETSCGCPHCDSVCEGQFGGCAEVWARGPRAVQLTSPRAAEHLVGNRQLDHGPSIPRSEDPVSMAGAPASSDTALNVVAWPQAPMHAVRMELEALSAAMAHQQAVLSQLVNGYSDLRRASEKESLLSAVRTVLEGPLQRLEASLREDVARDSRRLDEVVGGLHELTAAQRAHQESVTAGREELRTELHDALGEERRELSQEFAATTAVVGETKGLLSELKESVVRLQASAEAERERDRQVIGQWLYAMAESIGRVVSEAVTQAVADGEERMFDRLEAGVRQFRHSLKDMEEVSARQRMEAERVEGERLHVLHACLAELTDALRGTHALAAAQREETDLLDGAMSTLQESLVDLRASVAKQHVEVREDLARQRRSTGELIKRQLRPITESLPELVADAARAREEETLKRVERAVAKLRRSLEPVEARRAPAPH